MTFLLVGVYVLLTAGLILGLPIAVARLFVQTRRLRARVEALEAEVRRRPPAAPDIAHTQTEEPSPIVPPRSLPAPGYVAAEPFRPRPGERSPEADAGDRHQVDRHPDAESLEAAIGTRWLLYVGVAAIVIGIAYFEKLAIDYGWIGVRARVVQGTVVGLGLIYGGTRFVRRGYDTYGRMMAGGGGAILYLSVYAAFTLYALIGRPAAFTLMVAITIVMAWLADRERSQGLALFAVGGGFATPFLLPGPTDAQIALFTYDAILIAATAVLSRRREWPFLHLVSYVFTLLTVAAWADRFYAPAKYLRTELFLSVYCAMFIDIARQCRRGSGTGKLVALMLWTAPAAYYFASLAILVNHDRALLAWLVGLMLAGAIGASRAGPALGLGVWSAATLPLLLWCTTRTASAMRREGLIALTGIYAIALLAQLEATTLRDEPRAPGRNDLAWAHLNPLGTYAGAYLLISKTSLVWSGNAAAGFGLWHMLLAAALWRRRPAYAAHFLAVGFTLLAIAAALLLDGAAVTAGWAVEGAVVMALAIRQRLLWLRLAGAALFVVALMQTLALLAAQAPIGQVLFFNAREGCALLTVSLCYLLAWLDSRDVETESRRLWIGAALIAAQILTLAALSSEIVAYSAIHGGHLERGLMLSITWGVYATALVIVGLARGYAPIRYFAIVVLGVTIAKVFLVDMAQLERIYRVGSVIALGILLLLTSYLYSRSRKTIDDRISRL